MKPLKKFKRLAKKAIKIRDNPELTWQEKFDLTFELIDKINKTGIRVEWCNPDTSYEDDVRAYINAVEWRLG